MRIYDLILKKRSGACLSDKELKYFVDGTVDGSIPDYQISAFLTTVFYEGMTGDETAALTRFMAQSGDMLDLSEVNGMTVDKHSTGGVGDKTTLIVAPIVAALGGKVAKLSGKGLGHTGGTIDKLESIPGFKTAVSPEDFIKQVNEIGICIAGQSGNLAPADKKLYALRDVTATVDCIPLIASSIMSKKIAAGCKAIVLDVKTGSGAFMKTPQKSRELARTMIDIGNAAGRKTAALITNMDIPLGKAIGNSLEVFEAVEILKGGGSEDLKEICIALAANMLMFVNGKTYEECMKDVFEVINNGKAFDKFREMTAAQGGDVSFIDRCENKASVKYEIYSEHEGYISHMNTEEIGAAAMILGAGRKTKDDKIDCNAGIILSKKTGDFVKKGDLLCTLYTNRAGCIEEAKRRFLSALSYGGRPEIQLIYEVLR